MHPRAPSPQRQTVVPVAHFSAVDTGRSGYPLLSGVEPATADEPAAYLGFSEAALDRIIGEARGAFESAASA